MVDLIGATKNLFPFSSRTEMPLPCFAKFGRSVPTRWAIKQACLRASFRDEHS